MIKNKAFLKKGVASLIVVMMVSVVIVLIAAGWQSRLLLSIYRSQTWSDSLVLSYHAESKAYDMVSRFLKGYAHAFIKNVEGSETLADGTILEITGRQEGRNQIITVLAKRKLGTTRIEVVREDMSASATKIVDTDILFVLDCTGSMSSLSCPTCSTTRMDEQKAAVINFINQVSAISKGKIRLGLSVFSLKSDWIYTNYLVDGSPSGIALSPDAGMTAEELVVAINGSLTSEGGSGSLACKKLLTATSVGSGLAFAHDYFGNTKGPGKKQIEILITDGEPNQRIPYADCPINIFCPLYGDLCNNPSTGWSCPVGSGDICQTYARDFLRCTLASNEQNWIMESPGIDQGDEFSGIRDPNVSMYSLTVLDYPPEDVMKIFQSYSTKHFDLQKATDLTEALQEILQEIVDESANLEIRKVIP